MSFNPYEFDRSYMPQGQTESLGQRIIDAAGRNIQIGVGTDGGDIVLQESKQLAA